MRRFLSGRVVLLTKIAGDQCECWGEEVGGGFSARVSVNGDAGWSHFLSGRVGGVIVPLAAGRVVPPFSVGLVRADVRGAKATTRAGARGTSARTRDVMAGVGWHASGLGRPGLLARRRCGGVAGGKPRCGACRSRS